MRSDSTIKTGSFAAVCTVLRAAAAVFICLFCSSLAAAAGTPTCPEMISDGGFETGGIPNNFWDPETSKNFLTPLCTLFSCGNGGGASPPRSGSFWAWFGGIPAPETATLGQTVTMPAGGRARLRFWMRSGTVSDPFTDVLNVRVDGNIVRTFSEPELAETVYSTRIVDLSAFADGASHQILFEYVGQTFGTASYVIDDVSLTAGCGTAPFDYDADGRTDLSVFRPSDGAWYLQKSTEGLFGMQFGFATDRIAPADFDGDGKTDIVVFRPSDQRWYIANSSDGSFRTEVFGLANDLPAPADYDGDGRADLCVFRPDDGTWYLQRSSNGSFLAYQFGSPDDKPTVGDFDGDGKSDFAVFRTTNGEWYQSWSSDVSIHGEQFGFTTDRLAYADYDGDGKTDLAIFRPDTRIFYVKNSATSTYDAFFFGLSEDIPTPGDYDGDGKADLSVFRPSDGNWYRQNSSNGSFNAFQFGLSGDRPTPTAYQ